MQCNWRHLQQMGAAVVQRYTNDADYASVCRLLPSLAFVPVGDVADAFDQVADYIEQNYPELIPYTTYFETTFVGLPNRGGIAGRRAPRFPIHMWNMWLRVNNNQARTNNAVEGWHRGLSATLGITNPTIWKFLDAMRSTFRQQERDLEQLIAGRQPSRQRKQWTALTQRLQTVCNRYAEAPLLEFLRGITYNFNY